MLRRPPRSVLGTEHQHHVGVVAQQHRMLLQTRVEQRRRYSNREELRASHLLRTRHRRHQEQGQGERKAERVILMKWPHAAKELL